MGYWDALRDGVKMSLGQPVREIDFSVEAQLMRLEVAFREALAREIDAKLRPLLDVDGHDDGYNCCGCATPAVVLRDALALIRGESVKLGSPLD